MACPGVQVVSDMDRSLQDVLKKRNRPNARQRRHRRAARSPVEDMAFCAPLHRVVICMVSMQERLVLKTKDADSARCGSPEIILARYGFLFEKFWA